MVPLSSYAPDLNPTGVWSLLKRSPADFAAADPDPLVRVVERELHEIATGPVCSTAASPDRDAPHDTTTTPTAVTESMFG